MHSTLSTSQSHKFGWAPSLLLPIVPAFCLSAVFLAHFRAFTFTFFHLALILNLVFWTSRLLTSLLLVITRFLFVQCHFRFGGGGYIGLVSVGICHGAAEFDSTGRPIQISFFQEKVTYSYTNRTDIVPNLEQNRPIFFKMF